MKEGLWKDSEPQNRSSGGLASIIWVTTSTKREEFMISQMSDSVPRSLLFLELDADFGHEDE